MDTEKIIKEAKTMMIVSLVIGWALLAVGLVFGLIDISPIPNSNAIVGLSLIPFGVAFTYYLKIKQIKLSPQKMRHIIIGENDERLVAQKNEADAKAFKIIQGALFLAYMGYTLIVPGDVFETVGWWILLSLLMISFLAQVIMSKIIMGQENAKDDEEK